MADDQGTNVTGVSGLVANVNTQVTKTEVDTREQSLVDYAGDTYGTKLQLAESNIGTVYATDFGAIQAGLQLGLAGAESAQRATDAARQGLAEAGQVLREKAESDVSKTLKPLGYTAVALFLIWVIGKQLTKGKA